MSRVIVEDCVKIPITTVNENIGAVAKQYSSELHELGIVSDYPVNDKSGLPHQWGLNDFFSAEKPEWQDMDDWMEDTTYSESEYLWLPKNKTLTVDLRITASPIHKNKLKFTHAGRTTVWSDEHDRQIRDSVEKSYIVNLTKAPRKYGGFQYYFVCPLAHNGLPCHRDVSMLYLPPGATLFGCRHCYNLSYACRNASRPGRDDRSENRAYDMMLQLYEKWGKKPDDSKNTLRLYDAVIKEGDAK